MSSDEFRRPTKRDQKAKRRFRVYKRGGKERIK